MPRACNRWLRKIRSPCTGWKSPPRPLHPAAESSMAGATQSAKRSSPEHLFGRLLKSRSCRNSSRGRSPFLNSVEAAAQFACAGDWLMGLVHLPPHPRERGVVVITGGPQYRVGSHRQFTLLARKLAAQNFPVLRFDYRGMGDSEGEPRSFEHMNADIRAAVDVLFAQV